VSPQDRDRVPDINHSTWTAGKIGSRGTLLFDKEPGVLSEGGEGRLAPAPIESDLARAAIDEVIE
jgi:hypothetical protein